MIIEELFSIEAIQGSIFVDNLALCSADRIITGNYEAIRGDSIFADEHGGGRDAVAVLISHDLVNLAIILESFMCFDHMYVNAEYVDRWNHDIRNGTLAALGDLVSGVTLSSELRWATESAVVKSEGWRRFSPLAGEEILSSLVHISTHNAWDRYGDTQTMKTRLLSPYQEATRPFPGAGGIYVGAGFYMGCSQALGVPYRPSALRARLMEELLANEVSQWRYNAGSLAFHLLEEAREEAMRKCFSNLVDLNIVEFGMPAVLGAVLANVQDSTDIIPLALQLRNLPEAREFREWCTNLAVTIHHGRTEQIAKEYKALKRLLDRVNRRLGVAPPKEVGLAVGWGPVQASRSFALPKAMNFPVRLQRHAWFLQNIYKTILQTARFSDQVKRIFYPRLPDWISELLGQKPIAWMEVLDRKENQ